MPTEVLEKGSEPSMKGVEVRKRGLRRASGFQLVRLHAHRLLEELASR